MSAFRNIYGRFEPAVVQFGTANAPAHIQWDISKSIRKALDNISQANLDDILIHTNSEEEHVKHEQCILQCLPDAECYLKSEKFEFHKEIVIYLGLVISTNRISIDEDNVATMRNWSHKKKMENSRLKNLFKVQQFPRYCKYFCHFTSRYS